jgi:hypothetical protein
VKGLFVSFIVCVHLLLQFFKDLSLVVAVFKSRYEIPLDFQTVFFFIILSQFERAKMSDSQTIFIERDSLLMAFKFLLY